MTMSTTMMPSPPLADAGQTLRITLHIVNQQNVQYNCLNVTLSLGVHCIMFFSKCSLQVIFKRDLEMQLQMQLTVTVHKMLIDVGQYQQQERLNEGLMIQKGYIKGQKTYDYFWTCEKRQSLIKAYMFALYGVLLCTHVKLLFIVLSFSCRQVVLVSANDIVIKDIENTAKGVVVIFFVRGMNEGIISAQTVLEAVQVL